MYIEEILFYSDIYLHEVINLILQILKKQKLYKNENKINNRID